MVHAVVFEPLHEGLLRDKLRLYVNAEARLLQNVQEFVETLLLTDIRVIFDEQAVDRAEGPFTVE